MQIPPSLKKFLLDKSPFAIAVAVLVMILGIGAHLDEFDKLESALTKVILKGLEIDWVAKKVALSDWLAIVILLLLAAVAILALLYLQAKIRSKPGTAVERRIEKATNTLRKTMAAASQIRDQIFPPAEIPSRNILHCEGTYLIHKNYDLDVRIHYKVSASDRPLHFMEVDIWVEDLAVPMEFLDEINLKIVDAKNQPIPYLPSRNDVHHKSAIFYFLPALDPHEAHPRDVIVTFFWPGGLNRLGLKGSEEYVWNLKSVKDIPEALYGFFIEGGTGKDLTCRVTGSASGKQTVHAKVNAHNGWKGWEYKVENAPEGTYKLTLDLLKP